MDSAVFQGGPCADMTVAARNDGALPAHRCRGFSLLEVLVAFAIMALALGALMQVFSTGLRTVTLGDEYTRAVLLAESKLAAMGVEEPLQEGEQSGTFDEHYRWRTVTRAYTEPEAPGDAAGGGTAQGAKGPSSARQVPKRFPGRLGQGTGADPFGEAAGGSFGNLPLRPYEVMVEVFWGSSGEGRSVALTSLKLAVVGPG
jgi:general secretion pathway protein I